MSEKNSTINLRLLPLHGLQIFLVLAEAGSLTKAAEELCLTKGAISKQIKLLEGRLGFDLFEKKGRCIVLTKDGALLKHRCSGFFQNIRESIYEIKNKQTIKSLVISCEPTIAIKWLIPRINEFMMRFPHVQVSILAAGGEIDFYKNSIDLAIRRNDFSLREGQMAKVIGTEFMALVCDKKNLAILTKDSNVIRIHSNTRLSAWNTWKLMNKEEACQIKSNKDSFYEHFYLTIQAAIAGLGVTVASIYMVEESVRRGDLYLPYGFNPDGTDYILISPISIELDPIRMAFFEWIKDEFAKTKAALESSSTN